MLPPTIHATTVANGDRAVLLLGPSGAGKSALALRLIDRGWRLVADDRTVLAVRDDRLVASAPPALAGLIEVRGVGIVPEPTAPATVVLALDLAAEPERLPEPTLFRHAGVAVPRLAFDGHDVAAPLKVERAFRRVAASVKDSVPAASSEPPRQGNAAAPVLIVSGLSGAGKSTALKALEDLDYEAVDNLPLTLIESFLAPSESRPLAIGIDTRTRNFEADALVAALQRLRSAGVAVRLMFLDCSDDELVRRFSETRRRHPLALDRPAADGVARERIATAPLRQFADFLIDTTDLGVTDLRRRIAERLGRDGQTGLAITLQSFGFAQGLPRNADLVFDMRFLANPHWDAALRPLSGEDPPVAAFVAADPLYAPAVDGIAALLATMIPGYAREGRAYLTIAIGCTGGRHRSVAVASELARRLTAAGHAPLLVHRDLAKPGPAAAAAGLTSAPEASQQAPA